MKKLLIFIVLITGYTALAQHRDHQRHEHLALRDMSPEQIATLSSKKLALALDLDANQLNQVKELQLQRVTEQKALMKERRESDKTAAGAEDRFNRMNDRLDRQLAYKGAMKQILTDDQYARWERMRVHRAKDFHKAHQKYRKEGRR